MGHNVAPEDLKPGNLLWSRAVSLLKTFDPNQVRCAASEWRVVLEFVSRAAEVADKVIHTSKLERKYLEADDCQNSRSLRFALLETRLFEWTQRAPASPLPTYT